jgi:branched-chain amino acid transport system ATP-binding protein
MLSIHDAHTFYGESHVLQGVTLTVEKGTIVSVLGRNGVGKTTMCRSVTGLTPARAGRVIFDGVEITRLPPHRIFRMGLSLVPQGRRVFPSLTVEENLSIVARRVRSQATPDPLDKVFALFPRLGERRHQRGAELSGGEQQMLAIARALAANPALVVMDEPTEGLSPALVAEIGHLIRRIRDEGTTVLLVEQNAAFAVKLADHACVMSQGRIVYASEPATLWADERVKTQLLGVPPRRSSREGPWIRIE